MEEFYRIRRLPPYVFETVNRAKAVARNAGVDIIDSIDDVWKRNEQEWEEC